MKLYDNDSYRDEFMNGVYALLSNDSTCDRANQIIDLFDHAPAVEATIEPPDDPLTLKEPLESHSETEIVKGCIALMRELTGRFEDYLDFMNITPENDEERFMAEFTYFQIVQRLLLWTTYHSGGTSTMEKCQELGVDSGATVIFADTRNEAE